MIDQHSDTWKTITDRIAAETDGMKNQLTKHLTMERTTQIRDRIRAFEDVLSWATEVPDTPDEGIEIQV